MKHEGQIIKKAIAENGLPITVLTKKLGKSRGWFYNIFNSASVSIDKIIQIGTAINYDFSSDISKLKKNYSTVEEPREKYVSAKEEKLWKEKYLTLLEEHNKVLKEYADLVSKPKKKR